MKRALALALALVCALSGAVASASPSRLEGVAAIVGAASLRSGVEVILLSDVELEAHLERARASEDSSRAITSAERSSARERLIGRALLVHEARRLRLDVVDDDDRALAWRRFFDHVGGARSVEGLEASVHLADGELDAYVELDAIARAFVLASADQGAIVTDSEIDEVFDSGDHPFVGMSLESVREPMRALLLERRAALEGARWVELLRARVVVRRNRLD